MDTGFTKIAIACQGGGSHCAYTSGVLAALMRETAFVDGRFIIDGRYELVGLSGTSGGAIGAYLAWTDLLRLREPRHERPQRYAVERFWDSMKAQPFPWPPTFPSPDLYSNWLQLVLSDFDGVVPMISPSPNPVTALAQQQLGAAIEAAAGLSPAERRLGGPPLASRRLKALGPGDFPLLLIGAANLDDSEFEPFLSTPSHRPDTAQLLASTALPEFYPAVTVDCEPSPGAQQKSVALGLSASASATPGRRPGRFWDGLLSQNPPLGDFLSVPLEHRPRELWIIRINPAKQDVPAGSQPTQLLPGEIRDRRNELAGNLSLEQEKRFIRKINALVRQYPALADSCQVVDTWGIALDGPWDCPEIPGDARTADGTWRSPDHPVPPRLQDLDATSKLNRFAPFIDALADYGGTCCTEFLAHRRQQHERSRQRAA